jgi:hypothetical protein
MDFEGGNSAGIMDLKGVTPLFPQPGFMGGRDVLITDLFAMFPKSDGGTRLDGGTDVSLALGRLLVQVFISHRA